MRDYDPTTGRYLQADPLGLEAGVSLYGYALQNPSRFIDPTGENPIALPIAFCEAFPTACVKVAEVCIAGAIVAIGYIANELWGPPDPQISTSDEGICDQCSFAKADPSIGRKGGAASGERINKHPNKKGGNSTSDKHTKKGAGTKTKARGKSGWYQR